MKYTTYAFHFEDGSKFSHTAKSLTSAILHICSNRTHLRHIFPYKIVDEYGNTFTDIHLNLTKN